MGNQPAKTKRKTFGLADIKARIAANASLREANPGLSLTSGGAQILPNCPPAAVLVVETGKDTPKAKKRGKKRKEMNATEREFLLYLRSRYPGAQIDYEGVTLRFGEGNAIITYTPDFIVTEYWPEGRDSSPELKVIFFETKGGYAWEKDVLRFRAARAYFKHFDFRLWEKGDQGWQQTI